MNSPKNMASKEAAAFVVDAMDVIWESMDDEEVGFRPYLLVENVAGKRSIVPVMAPGVEPDGPVTEADVATGRDLLRDLFEHDAVAWAALVYDTYLTIGKTRSPALIGEIVEGGLRHMLAQRYSWKRSGALPVGRLMYLAGDSVDGDP